MQLSSIKELINAITFGTHLFICIHDTSGLFSSPLFQIDLANCWHTIDYCNLAKTTSKGHSACINCKYETNNKVIEKGSYICRTCSFGLDEIVRPVFISGKPKCIIYIGNMVINPENTLSQLKSMCQITGSPYEKMKAKIKNCEFVDDISPIVHISEVIESYIKFLYEYDKSSNKDAQWLVAKIIDYIHLSYSEKITIKDMANLFFYNEKHLGKMFKKYTGTTFNQYINNVRLKKATELLANSEKNITEIALNCGFTDSAYFNRLFKSRMNITPSEYRKLCENESNSNTHLKK